MNKILDFIFKNIKNIYVLGALSIISGVTYFKICQQSIILIVFITNITFLIFALMCLICNKIKTVIIEKRRDYNRLFEETYNIYKFLNKKEREIYYDLFYSKEKIVSSSDFYLDYVSDIFSQITEKPFSRDTNKHYILRCQLNEIYFSGKGMNKSKGWKSYRFTMDPSYKKHIKIL